MKKILSTFLLRSLVVACGLFVGIIHASAVYYESIEVNKEYYICNVANGLYLANNAGSLVLVASVQEADAWKFTSSTQNRKTYHQLSNDGYYLQINPAVGTGYTGIYETDPGAAAVGDVELVSSSSSFTLSGDLSIGYEMSVDHGYGLFSSTKRTFYFANNFTAVQNRSNVTKWKLVSKRQVDNTISLSPSFLELDAVLGSTATKRFYVEHNGNPTAIIVEESGSSVLKIDAPLTSPHMIDVSYGIAADGNQTIVVCDANNVSNKVEFNFVESIKASVNLTVSTTAVSGNASDAEKKSISISGNVVKLKQQMISWEQDFTTLSPIAQPIELSAKAIDELGISTGNEIKYTLAAEGIVKVENGILYVLKEGTTSITASVATSDTYVGCESIREIVVSSISSSNNNKIITPANAEHPGIYTGTIGGVHPDYTFHRDLREVNLQKCFDNTDQPLFDTLYIFGVTSNTDGTLVSYVGANGTPYNNVPVINDPRLVYDADGNYLYTVPFNATTPCYVYANTGNSYEYERTFDATKTRYSWGQEQENNHIYFTGYCPFAYMGVTPTENGWMYFQGDGGTSLDIYLDSCQIMGRYKTQSGLNTGYENYVLELEAKNTGENNPNINFMSGVSAPFVFTSLGNSSSEKFKVNFHIAGKNHLQGQLGAMISKTLGNAELLGAHAQLDAGISGVQTYSAPIVIMPTNLNQYTDLEMSDIWRDGTITNGYLKLDANKGTYLSEKVAAIDLGSPNASLTINGGQYHLRNSAADGTYTCNMAVGYRRFSKLAEYVGIKVLIYLYGFGGDMTDSKVTINSGTFTMYKNMYYNGLDSKGDSVYLGEGYYIDQDNFLDLRLPAGGGASQINGGTFNGISNVTMCTEVMSTGASPKNARGYWLCLHDVEITSEDNGVVTDFALSDPFNDVYTNDPCYDLTTTNNITGGRQYGAQSLNFYEKDIDGDSEKEKVVSLLLYPGRDCEDGSCCPNCEYQEESIIFQWATALPVFDAKKMIGESLQSIQIGGPTDVKVSPAGQQIKYSTNQLLYTDLEGMEGYEMQLDAQQAYLTINAESAPRGQFTNTAEYLINNHLNILKVVQADTWYTFTAPFNVHDISVIETNENAIDVTGRTRDKALQLQAEDNMKMLYDLQDFVIPNDEGRASSMTFPVMINMVLWSDGILDPSKPINLQPINPLTHYDGTNMMTAHYYLYELDIKDGETEFKTDGAGKTLDIKWKPVAKQNSPTVPILEAGKVYAMQFPWCPMCNDLYVDDPTKKRTYYDYWSNKLILFHGNGPQTVSGTTDQSSLITTPTSGHATLSGNTTLADMTLTAQTAYVHNPANDIFELNDVQYVVKPTEGFLLYKSGTNNMPARISRTGQIEYDENAETGVDGVPTVGDRTSLMLFGAYDGFEVLALHEQLVTVYNLQGNIIFQQYMTAGEQVYVPTGAGIYVVRGESEAIKVMIE